MKRVEDANSNIPIAGRVLWVAESAKINNRRRIRMDTQSDIKERDFLGSEFDMPLCLHLT